MKNLCRKFIIFIIIFSVMVSVSTSSVSAEGITVSFIANKVIVGEKVTLTVTLDAGEAMYGIQCVINYDNNVINYTSGNAVGGSGTLQIVEAPSGETKVSYVLTFTAAKEGNCTVTVTECNYAAWGQNGIEEKSLNGASVTLDVVSAQDTIIKRGICGENAVWNIMSNGVLKISGNGPTFDYGTKEEVPWYNCSNNIDVIEIGSDITYIGHYSFNCLENVKNVIVYNGELLLSKYYVFNKNNKATIYSQINSAVHSYATDNNFKFYSIADLIPKAPEIALIQNNTVTLEYIAGYEYSNDGINWQKENVFRDIEFDVVQCFYQRALGDESGIYLPSSLATKCLIVSTPKIFVGETTLKFVPIEGYKYSVNGIKYQTDNLFTELVPNWNYTVYHEPVNTEGIYVYKENNKAVYLTNGNDKIENYDSTQLVWLRKKLFQEDCNNIGADINEDFIVDIRDLVALKRILV